MNPREDQYDFTMGPTGMLILTEYSITRPILIAAKLGFTTADCVSYERKLTFEVTTVRKKITLSCSGFLQTANINSKRMLHVV